MPICETDPWRMQYFEGVDCPEDVRIPTEDGDAWSWYPRHKWVYNKLAIAESQAGTLDLFLDEDIAYAQRLLADGVPVELHVYPGAYHGSPNAVPASPVSQRWAADERAALDRALNGAS